MNILHQQFRDLAVTMLKQGKSPAEAWEALVSKGMDSSAAEALVRELLELRRQAEAAAAAYSPPVLPVAQALGWDEADQGDVWKGLIAGLCCGCWAILGVLILSNRSIGSETKKGVYIGTVINLFFGIIYAMVNNKR